MKSVNEPFLSKNKFNLLLIFACFISYFNSFFSPFIWDDIPQIQNNYLIQSVSNAPNFFLGSTFGLTNSVNLSGLYYRPLMTFVFSVIFSVFGSNTFYFHFLQVTIHCLNGFLLFFLLKKFFKEKLALFLTLIFLVHPINVESVSYISALQEPLFFIFGITALLLSMKETISLKRGFTIGLLLLCSLLSKESGFLFIMITLAFRFIFKRSQMLKLSLFTSSPLLIYLFLRFEVAKIFLQKIPEIPMQTLPLSQRIFSMPAIFLYYIKTFFFPYVLLISQQWSIAGPNINFYIQTTVLLAIIAVIFIFGLFLSKRHKKLLPSYLFFVFWLLTGIGFHLQILPLDMTVSDRWFYFPIVGILGLIGIFIQLSESHKVSLRNVFIFIGVLVILLLSLRTIIRNVDWQSGINLYTYNLMYQKNDDLIENALAVELNKAGDFKEAEVHFKNLISRNPNQPTLIFNLGVLYESEGKYDEAKSLYEKVLKKDGQGAAYSRLSLIYLQHEHNFLETKKISQQGVQTYPDNGTLWSIEAVADYELNNYNDALKEAEKAKQLMPSQQTENIYNTIINHLPFN